MNDPQVDFSQVKWEDVPQSKTTDAQDIDWSTVKWEDVPPTQPATVWERPSMSSLNKIRMAFTDTKAFASMGDDEQENKKQALTAYYANGKPENIPAVYNTLDTHIKEFHGKPLSIDQAFGEIANIFQAKPETYKPEVSGAAKLALATGPIAGALAFTDTAVREQAGALLAESAASLKRSFYSVARPLTKLQYELSGSIHKDEVMAEKTKRLEDTDKFINEMKQLRSGDDWNKGTVQTFSDSGVAAGVEKMAKNFLVSVPELGAIIYSGALAIPALALMAGTSRYNELDMNNPELTETQKNSSAAIDAFATAIFFGGITHARVLGIPITQKIVSEVKDGLFAALWDFAKRNALQTAQPELVAATNHVANKFLDIPNKEGLLRTLFETGVDNLLPNAAFSYSGTRNYIKMETARAEYRGKLMDAEKNLLSIENPTDAEVTRLRDVQRVLESRNMDDAMRVSNFETWKGKLDEYRRCFY